MSNRSARSVFSHIYHFNKTALLHSAAMAQTRFLEVERKFIVTPTSISYLRASGGNSIFKKHESLGKKTTHDVYYDQDTMLFSKGVYVRRRNGSWEAKIRAGGDFINSAFHEVEGINAVKELIKQNSIVFSDTLGIDEVLEPCSELVAERESWMIDGRFKVDVDTTDFGHVVGEVELTSAIQCANAGNEMEKEKKLKEKMDKEIEAFMNSYPQAFPAGRPLGKLSAYRQFKQAQQ